MSHWSFNDEIHKQMNSAKSRARRTVKEIFGAVLASKEVGATPKQLLELAEQSQDEQPCKQPSKREQVELQLLSDLGL